MSTRSSVALLGDTTTEIDVARKNRVFCNRNLRMDSIEVIGFDMDYTLALYHQDRSSSGSRSSSRSAS